MSGQNIVVIGSSNIDLIMKMDRLPEKGETVTDASFMQVYGGKGANQAVAAARAGGNVAFVNCVGADAYTPQMVKNYQEDGIDTTYVFEDENTVSGHALIMIGGDGDNCISVAPGANYTLTPERVEDAKPVIEKGQIVLLQYEIREDTLKRAIDLANELGVPVVWNCAPAKDFDISYLSKINILVVNELEAEHLSGIKVSDKSSAQTAMNTLLSMGSGMVILTMGKVGALLNTETESIRVPAFEVDAVDTTAAGDVFCGAFSVAYSEGKSLEESLRFASAASAICVTRMGAQPSAPKREEIEIFLREKSH